MVECLPVQETGDSTMIRMWRIWLAVLWNSEHIWAYYVGLLLLFLCKIIFTVEEVPITFPLYGLFITNLTLSVLKLHSKYRMNHFVSLSGRHPMLIALHYTLFSLVCTLPACGLLLVLTKTVYETTPTVLLVMTILEFTCFAIAFAFVCSIFPFRYALACSVIVYFLFMVMHGYRLERIHYVAPTLNFMYPDFPDMSNIAAITLFSMLMLGFYLWQHFDWPTKAGRWLLLINALILAAYLLIPVGQALEDKQLAQAPYRQAQIGELSLQYKGVSAIQAQRFGQAIVDILAVIHAQGLQPDLTEIQIIRRTNIPEGADLEHIMSLEGTTLIIQPYSNKFYEFNYGYNIIRDLLDLTHVDNTIRQRIMNTVVLEDRHQLFTGRPHKAL